MIEYLATGLGVSAIIQSLYWAVRVNRVDRRVHKLSQPTYVEPAKPERFDCYCGHSIGVHSGKNHDGECLYESERWVYRNRKGKDMDGDNYAAIARSFFANENGEFYKIQTWKRCPCQAYIGPRPEDQSVLGLIGMHDKSWLQVENT